MEFYQYLNSNNLTNLLNRVEFDHPKFLTEDKLYTQFDNIRKNKNKLKVLVHGDCDVDGVFSAKIILEFFKLLKCDNVDFFEYKKRTHNLDYDCVRKAIDEKYSHLIILDSSTNDLPNIYELVNNGVMPIIIDHHNPKYNYNNYPSECVIVNNKIDNGIIGKEKYKLSCGALTFCLCSKYLKQNFINYEYLSSYALATLYSDCIDMTNDLNRGIYYMAVGLETSELPAYFKHFMNYKNVEFNRRFIEFNFCPKINSLFRAEKLEIVNNYFFREHKGLDYTNIINDILKVYEESSKLVNMVVDLFKPNVLNNIVYGDLSNLDIPVKHNKLFNYTGLIANSISQNYGKPCVITCYNGTDIKGSFRDCFSRRYLKIFSQFCKAEGHDAAFGISINNKDYRKFIRYLTDKVDKNFFNLGIPELVKIEINENRPDKKLINDIALYNEFAGIECQKAIITKKNNLTLKKSFSKYYPYCYSFGSFTINSSKKLPPNYNMEIMAIKAEPVRLVIVNKVVTI